MQLNRVTKMTDAYLEQLSSRWLSDQVLRQFQESFQDWSIDVSLGVR